MGFGKKADTAVERDGKFKPSTAEELKRYGKAARKADAERKVKKENGKVKDKTPRLNARTSQEALEGRMVFKVYRNNFFDAFVEECKELEIRIPRYRAYMKEADAVGQLMFEINGALSRMSWTALLRMVNKGIVSNDAPTGVATRSWTQVFEFAQHVMHLALGVSESKGTYRLADLNVLEEWPAKEMKRKSKEEREMSKAQMIMASKDEDEDEDAAEEEEEEVEEEEEEDEEEEKPAKKKPAAKKKASKAKPKKSDDDDDGDDEDEVEITDKSIVSKVKSREKGGAKSKFLDLIPKKGIKVKELLATAKEELEVSQTKSKAWLNDLVGYGYVKVS